MMNFDPSKIDRGTIIKGVIILVVIIALYFGVRKVIKTIKADSTQKNLDAEIKTNQLSYPLNQYISMADMMDNSFTYLTTDETTVYSIFKKMNTLSDLLQLNKAFGLRDFYGFFGNMSLAGYIQRGLSTDEKAQVNKILKTNSVDFSF